MKSKTSLLALAVSTAFLCCSVTSLIASADTQYDCDVNGDGRVTIADVLAMNKYLFGMYYVSSPSTMDIDGNLIIDAGDSACVMAEVMGQVYSTLYD
ncbi:MAG: hypothetical protein IJ265_09345 [Oscillospiraceae bacterium]|nr:hypothetical protein [Oscillospiraceae bacterium]